jgi:hypothetical protein
MKRLYGFAGCFLAVVACIAAPPAAETAVPAAPSETNAPPGQTATASEPPSPGTVDVWVFYTLAADENMTPVPVARTVPDSDNDAMLVHSTLTELLKGPTDAEKAAGLTSWFSPATAGAVTGVVMDNGDFTILFTGLNAIIPNASTSAGSQMLLSQLNSTVFQFDFVQTAHYELDGDCAAFWEWLQMGCHAVTRAEWEAG